MHFCIARMCCLVEGAIFGSGRLLTMIPDGLRLAVRGWPKHCEERGGATISTGQRFPGAGLGDEFGFKFL